MICKNCQINEREEPFDWCPECLDSQELTTKWFPQRQREPRRIWETHFKRKVPEGHHIHHKDCNHDNIDPGNLICLSLEEHIKIHELAGDDIPLRILRRMLQPLRPKQARLQHSYLFFRQLIVKVNLP